MMRRLTLSGFIAGALAVTAYAVPAGPPAGNPILNSHIHQRNSEMNIDTATIGVIPNITSLPLGIKIAGAIYNSVGESTAAVSLPYNVRNYGAVGDGNHDDSAAFAAAIADAHNAGLNLGGYGQAIYAPEGVYRVAITVGAEDISIYGDPGATWFTPVDSTTFMLNFTGNANIHRFVTGINFYGNGSGNGNTWPGFGRGIYINSASNLQIQNCEFLTMEYGVYSNGSEWNHIFNCHFSGCKRGYVATTKNGDVLGNNPTNSQNSAASWFTQCSFWGNNISFYADDPDNSVGDHQAAFSFKQCEFLTSTSAIVAVYQPGVASLYYPLSIDYSWFEGNGGTYEMATGVNSFAGNTWRQGDLAVSGAQVSVEHVVFNGYFSLSNGATMIGDDIHFQSSIEVSTDSFAYMSNVLMDYQNGRAFDWAMIDNLTSFNADRPAMARSHAHTDFTYGGAYKNVVSTSVTSSCAFGTLPLNISGSPTISYFNGDGFYGNTSVKIVGKAGDSARWPVTISSGSWYVTTFSVRGSSDVATQSSTFTLTMTPNVIVPTGVPIRVGPVWRHYASIGKPGGGGTIGIDLTLQTATTIYMSAFQAVEFPTEQEAKEFYNSSKFILSPTEIANGTVLSTNSVIASSMGSTGVYANYLSLPLNAGTWDLSGAVVIDSNTATGLTYLDAVISSNSATGSGDHVKGKNLIYSNNPSAKTNPLTIPPYQITLTQPATYYLKGSATYSGGTPKFDSGSFTARWAIKP